MTSAGDAAPGAAQDTGSAPSSSSGEYYQLEHGPTVKISVLERFRKGLQDSGKTLSDVFRESDANGNKNLEKDEFKVMVVKVCPDMPQSDIDSLMKAADRNKDGTIDLEEFCHTFKAGLGGNAVVGDFKAPGVPHAAQQDNGVSNKAGDAKAAEGSPQVNGDAPPKNGVSGAEDTEAVLTELEKSKGKSAADPASSPKAPDEKGGFLGPLMSCCGLGRDDEGAAAPPTSHKVPKENGPPPEKPPDPKLAAEKVSESK